MTDRLLPEAEEAWKELNRTITVLHRAQRAGKVTWSTVTRTGWDRFLRLAYKEGWLERPVRKYRRPPKNLLTSFEQPTPVEELRAIADELRRLRDRIVKVADTLRRKAK